MRGLVFSIMQAVYCLVSVLEKLPFTLFFTTLRPVYTGAFPKFFVNFFKMFNIQKKLSCIRKKFTHVKFPAIL